MLKLEDVSAADDIEKLIVLRKRLRLNQKEFSDLIGYTPNYIANIENYKMPLTNKLKRKIEAIMKSEFELVKEPE